MSGGAYLIRHWLKHDISPGGTYVGVRDAVPQHRGRTRGDDGLARAGAAEHAEVAHLVRGPADEGRAQEHRTAARGRRPAGRGQEEARHRRPVRGDEGPGRRLLADRGARSRPRGEDRVRVPDLGERRLGGGAPGPPDDALVDHDRDESLDELEEHLFRRESGRLVAILTGLFGTHNLALAEDVVQDAFLQALETWKFHGPPRPPWPRRSMRAGSPTRSCG